MTAYTTISTTELSILSQAQCAATMPVYIAAKMRAYGNKETSWPTRKTIINDLGGKWGMSTISKAIAELVKMGLIKRMYDKVANIWSFLFLDKVQKITKRDSTKVKGSFYRDRSSRKDSKVNSNSNYQLKDDRKIINPKTSNKVGKWINQALNLIFGLTNSKPKQVNSSLKSEVITTLNLQKEMYGEYYDKLMNVLNNPDIPNSNSIPQKWL